MVLKEVDVISDKKGKSLKSDKYIKVYDAHNAVSLSSVSFSFIRIEFVLMIIYFLRLLAVMFHLLTNMMVRK